MKSVQVLLSTYNGERYIEEQLDSILRQDYSNISILVRDDGSTDGTVQILKKYANQYSQVKYYIGKNIGAKESFFDLIKNADISMDYFAFSDQDDVWLPNKISMALNKLENMSQYNPLLYCCRPTLVNEELKTIPSSIRKHSIVPGFGNALIENVCTGCTCVFNKNLLNLVQNHIPEFTIMHDWWLYLTASCFGEVYYDENAYILYRQHQTNVVGIRTNYYDEFMTRLKNAKNKKGNVSKQAKEFLLQFPDVDKNNKILNSVVDSRCYFRYRIKILFSYKIYRQRLIDNIMYKLLFLIGYV